jgi:hypothetical protein
MLGYLDPILFPDDIEVLEVSPNRYVYPIFKNGSRSLVGKEYRTLSKDEILDLDHVEVFVRDPLGNIRESESIIITLTTQLETGAMPIITCKKTICRCGFCAPKTESREEFMQLIKRHVPVDVFQKEC